MNAILIDGLDPRLEMLDTQLKLARCAHTAASSIEWHRLLGTPNNRFLVCQDDDGQFHLWLYVQEVKIRTLPGHVVWKIDRLGLEQSADVLDCALAALCAAAVKHPRILRVELTMVDSPTDPVHGKRRVLTARGFRQVANSRIYERTLTLSLSGKTSERLLSELPRDARRNALLPARRGFVLREITDDSLAPRMQTLLDETMRRTGGVSLPLNWRGLIEHSRVAPHRSRLVGMFGNDHVGGELLAFGLAHFHGRYAHYDVGASTRIPGMNVPLAYAVLWDLITWSSEQGAQWFDFGGVTSGSSGSDDPLGGISDFKRRFSTEEYSAGTEWVFEPKPFKSAIAAMIGHTAHLIRR